MDGAIDWDDPDLEQPTYFDSEGACRCLHDAEDHDWAGCRRCDCPAHWEE